MYQCSTSPGSIPRYRNLYFPKGKQARMWIRRTLPDRLLVIPLTSRYTRRSNSVSVTSSAWALDASVHHYSLSQNSSTHRTLGLCPTPSQTASGECFLVRNTPAASPKFSSATIENMHFIFSKASSPAEREELKPLSTSFNPTSFLKCANTATMCVPSCACVLAFL